MPDLPVISQELLARYDVAGPRYTSYPTVPVWRDSFSADAYASALGETDPAEPISVYVHIPFCRSMCAYCGCNIVVSRDQGRADRYLDTLAQELALVGAALGGRRTIKALHLGGGTPTFLTPAQLERLVGLLQQHFDIPESAEQAVEINPVTATVEQLSTLAGLGFDRLSMGVQDLDDAVQDAIRRHQSFDETQRLMDYARGLGFYSINVDLIYGLPHQSVRTWARTMDQVLALRPDRVAAYSFAFLPHLRPNQRVLPADALPGGIAKLDLFRQAYTAFTNAGYEPIGMDHFAAPGDSLAEAARAGRLWRNFQGYASHHGLRTVAVGASAISDLGGVYAQNHRNLKTWRAAVEAGTLPLARGYALSAEDRARRHIINELMCNLSVDLGPKHGYQPELMALRPLAIDGMVELDAQRIRVTERGRMFLRNVAMVFDTSLNAPTSHLSPPSGGKARFSRTV